MSSGLASEINACVRAVLGASWRWLCSVAGLTLVWLTRVGLPPRRGAHAEAHAACSACTVCCRLPLDDPDRFRVEVLFRWVVVGSAGASACRQLCACEGPLPTATLCSPHPLPRPLTHPATHPPTHLSLCSPGAAYDPTVVIPVKKDHVLPVAPRVALHPEGEAGLVTGTS